MGWELRFENRVGARTQVEVVCGGSQQLFEGLRNRSGGFYLILDEGFALQHEEKLASLRAAALGVTIVPGGEASKTPARLVALCSAMVRAGLDRSGTLVVMGGGAVLDLGGLCAALHLRGVPLIQVPTTLLSAVDACLGGKCAVDLPEGRNLMGAFHFAEKLLVDPLFLRTLPPSEFSSGLGEVAKYGLGFSVELGEWLLGLPPLEISTSPDLLEGLIKRCLGIKSEIVTKDPWEREGLRRTLNLGHSLAHALEAFAGPGELGHGYAVGLGLRAELRAGKLPLAERRRGEDLLDRLGQPSSLAEVFVKIPEVNDLKTFFLRDKKMEGAWIHEPRIQTLGVCSMDKVEALPHLRTLLEALS